MNHPQTEKWIPYLFEDLPAAERVPLAEHLHDCAECRAQVERWQRTLRRLDAWKLPDVGRRRVPVPVLRWAAAAALVLAGFGLAFAAGRWSAPRPDLEQLRATVEPLLREEMSAQVTQQVRLQIDAVEAQRVADYVTLRKDLDTVAIYADASARDTRLWLTQFAHNASATKSEN